MSEEIEELFQQCIRRYESGETARSLIPSFESICKGSPKAAAAWTCLSWLYLLEGQAEKALKASQTAVKLDPVDAQPRINLTLAMLELKKTGVRQQVNTIKQILVRDPEQIDGVKANFVEGENRRPSWPHLSKVYRWLFEED
ncbi:MAG: tetratricopeptide repeat protein [Cyanobacteriota bacterium]